MISYIWHQSISNKSKNRQTGLSTSKTFFAQETINTMKEGNLQNDRKYFKTIDQQDKAYSKYKELPQFQEQKKFLLGKGVNTYFSKEDIQH